MIYPLYSFITNLFPSLVTLRYGKKEDSSFSLRNYLFEELKDLFLQGNFVETWFGRGNEFSRLYIDQLMGFDLMPHNDYLRLLIDWGIIGFLIYSIILYKIAIKKEARKPE
jgi:O-antigen ligase